MDPGAEQSGRQSLDNAPLPYGGEIEPCAGGRPSPVDGVAAEQVDGVAPHEDAQVVLGLGQKAVRVDQFEAAVVLEGVQLVHVAVDQHGPLVAVRLLPPASAGQGMVDRVPVRDGRAPPTTSR